MFFILIVFFFPNCLALSSSLVVLAGATASLLNRNRNVYLKHDWNIQNFGYRTQNGKGVNQKSICLFLHPRLCSTSAFNYAVAVIRL